MNDLILELEGENLVVHFKDEGTPNYRMNWSGKVYPIHIFSDKTWRYVSDRSSDSVEDIKDARCWFEFSFCWRGVWEGRIYFKNEEYWSEDLSIISDAWDQIEKALKNQIKLDNPEYAHFD